MSFSARSSFSKELAEAAGRSATRRGLRGWAEGGRGLAKMHSHLVVQLRTNVVQASFKACEGCLCDEVALLNFPFTGGLPRTEQDEAQYLANPGSSDLAQKHLPIWLNALSRSTVRRQRPSSLLEH